MPKSTQYARDVLDLFFNATAIANVAQNTATSPATATPIALHTADPGVAGLQTTSEISYTGYARVNQTRSTAAGGWVAADASGVTRPNGNIDFGAMTAGTGGTVNFASIGTTPSTTANKIIMYGAVSPTISVTNGVTPRLTSTSTITET
jgi:hypothetical protein